MSGIRIRKVLLADDDPDLRRLAQLSLSRVGKWQVLVAGTGEAAVEIACKEKPDLIVMDVSMPGMDGPTALRKLRENLETRETPVIFITARALPEEIEQHLAAGAAGVVTKPFDPLELPSRLVDILAAQTGAAVQSLPGSDVVEALRTDRAAYVAALPGKIAALAEVLEAARADPAARADARGGAHKLRGSAGVHGLLAVAEAAASIEEALVVLESAPARAAEAWRTIDEAIFELSSRGTMSADERLERPTEHAGRAPLRRR